MLSPRVLAAALVALAVLGPDSARAQTNATLCADSARVVLGSCGSLCNTDQPCVQFPSGASTKCSAASRNKCVVSDTTCTYQCLNQAYSASTAARKWTLFVKEPKTDDMFNSPTDQFPAALVDKVSSGVFSSETLAIQITGFDSASVQKGSVKTLAFDDKAFADVATLNALALMNIDLSMAQTGLLPKSISQLYLQNCNLKAIPADISAMGNLVLLNLTKNVIADVPATVATALQKVKQLDLSSNALKTFTLVLPEVTSLDLSNNALETFPTNVFSMTKLTTLNLQGNNFKSLVVTKAQFSLLKRLTATSSLGVTAVSGSCASSATEDKVLDAVVCISESAGASGSKSDSNDKSGDSGGSSSTIIIVVVVVAAVLVLGGAAFFCYRRRRNSSKDGEYFADMAYTNNNTNTPNRTGGSTRPGVSTNGRGRASSALTAGRAGPSFSTNGTNGDYSEIGRYASELTRESAAATNETQHARELPRISKSVTRIDMRDLNLTRSIAKGAFGQVWLGHLNGNLVAVKKMLTNDPQNVADFVAELNLLSTLQHPRILALVGACYDDTLADVQIVMEYMDSGDLLTVLRKHPPSELTWENGKGTFCVQICEAVYYLHSLPTPLIHRDIKSRNILMDSQKGAKLSDFGESRERTFQQTMTAGVGTARWVAPEIILGEDYSELADIYSLGVLLTELDTHKIPYQDMGLEETTIVQQVAVGKLKPKVSDSCPEVIRRLTHECLQSDPQQRPSAARVLQTLLSSTLARRPTTILETE